MTTMPSRLVQWLTGATRFALERNYRHRRLARVVDVYVR